MRPDLDGYLLAFGAARDRVKASSPGERPIPPPTPPPPPPRFLVEGRYSYALVEAADAAAAAHEYAASHGNDNDGEALKVSPIGEAVKFDVDVTVDVRARG